MNFDWLLKKKEPNGSQKQGDGSAGGGTGGPGTGAGGGSSGWGGGGNGGGGGNRYNNKDNNNPPPAYSTSNNNTGGKSSSTPASTSKSSKSNPDMAQIREIVKQESERRMVGFRKQMADVTQQRDTLQLELNRTKAELEGTRTVQHMRGQRAPAHGGDSELTARLREQLEESNTRCAIAESEKMTLQQTVREVKNASDASEAKANAFEAMEADLQAQFTQAMAAHKQTVKELKSQLVSATSSVTETANAQAEAKAVQAVQAVEAEAEAEALRVVKQRVEHLETECKQSLVEREQAVTAAQQATEESVSLRERTRWEDARKILFTQLETYKKQSLEVGTERDALTMAVSALELGAATAETKLAELEQELSSARLTFSQSEEQAKKHVEELAAWKTKVEKAEERQQSLEKQHAAEIQQVAVETKRQVEAASVKATLRASEETESERTQEMAVQLQSARDALATAEEERDVAVQSSATAASELATTQAERDSALSKVKAVKQAVQDEVAKATKVADAMRSMTKAHEKVIQSIKQEKQAMETEKQKLKQLLEEAQQTAEHAAQQAASNNIAIMQQLRDELVKTKADLEQTITAKELIIANNQANTKEAIENQENQEKENLLTATTLSNMTEERDGLMHQVSTLEVQLQTVSSGHVGKLNDAQAKHAGLVSTLELKIAALVGEIEEMREKLSSAENEMASAQQVSAKAVADAADENEQVMAGLRTELAQGKVDLDAARIETSRAESALGEALEGSAVELETRARLGKDENERQMESLRASMVREQEALLSAREETWRKETDELLRTTLEVRIVLFLMC
jgi:hypothetical protein